jgi:thioredoxin reductase (NADPH)
MGAPMVQAVQQLPNIEVLPGYQVREVVGPAHVSEVVVTYEGQEQRLRVDAAFVDLGLIPNSAIVQPVAQTDDDGFIVVDQRNATTVPGLFAAGDVTTVLAEQVLIAIGDGARAAVSAYDYYLLRSPAQLSR